MTPTEQDKELSKLLAYIDGSSDYNGAWFGDMPDGKTGRYWWRSELKQLITADRKRVALEARIDEAKDIRKNIEDLGTPVYFAVQRIDGHIGYLKQELEKL